jgi:hypothetical protein
MPVKLCLFPKFPHPKAFRFFSVIQGISNIYHFHNTLLFKELVMTLVNALESLKEKGIRRMVGLSVETDIDRYIQNAKDCDRQAQDIIKLYPGNEWARYRIKHKDDHFIVDVKGHSIITTTYDSSILPGTKFHLATYGSEYETKEEMKADFDEWSIKDEAEKIADEMMAERPGILSREGWELIAMKELEKYREKAEAAFIKLSESST